MAFGISGSNTSTNMVGADVVVTWINNDVPSAVDYYLTDRQQVCVNIVNSVLMFKCFCCDTSVGLGRGCALIQ